jgi:hypothetical protein
VGKTLRGQQRDSKTKKKMKAERDKRRRKYDLVPKNKEN